MFENYNKDLKSTVRKDIVLENLPFKPLKDFIGQSINVDGFFFTEGKFGKQVVLVGNGCAINMPKRYVEDFEKIAKNEAEVEAILTGHLVLTDIKSINTKNGTSTAFTYTNK